MALISASDNGFRKTRETISPLQMCLVIDTRGSEDFKTGLPGLRNGAGLHGNGVRLFFLAFFATMASGTGTGAGSATLLRAASGSGRASQSRAAPGTDSGSALRSRS